MLWVLSHSGHVSRTERRHRRRRRRRNHNHNHNHNHNPHDHHVIRSYVHPFRSQFQDNLLYSVMCLLFQRLYFNQSRDSASMHSVKVANQLSLVLQNVGRL
jgi:G3E family GTPase